MPFGVQAWTRFLSQIYENVYNMFTICVFLKFNYGSSEDLYEV